MFFILFVPNSQTNNDASVLDAAIRATAKHRDTEAQIPDAAAITKNIAQSKELRAMLEKYRKQFAYAKGIDFDAIVDVIAKLSHTTLAE